MRVSDALMLRWYELLTTIRPAELLKMKSDLVSGAKHPREAKVELAKFIIGRFHSQAAAQAAEDEFNRIFVDKGLPDEIPEVSVDAQEIGLLQLMTLVGLTASNGEAKRLVQGKAVEINQSKIEDEKLKLTLTPGQELILRAGKKKFAKVRVKQ